MEKQNKAARAKRKKEEMARIRTLVGKPPSVWLCVCGPATAVPPDNAYACDPRIKSFKEAEKAEKLAKKLAKEEAVKLEAQQRERVSAGGGVGLTLPPSLHRSSSGGRRLREKRGR